MRHSHHQSTSFVTRGRALVMATMLGFSSIVAPAALAQDASPEASPAATPAASQQQADVTTLMSATFEEFPPAPMTVRMLRITLEPGASTPMHTHPGPEFDIIESGELTFRSEGEAPVTRANGEQEVSTGEELVLGEGDWIMFPPEVGMYYINNGDEPVTMLSAVMLPVGTEYPQSITYTERQPTSEDFVGVSFVVLGDGLIQTMPNPPVTVSVNEVTVPAGVDLPAFDGIAMYSAVEGNFSFIVNDGMVQVSRSELASLQPNAVIGEEFILETGDAAFFPTGVAATSRDGETDDLRMYTLEMSYAEPIEQSPASLTFTNGASATGDATGGPETAEPAASPEAQAPRTAVVNSEVVNVRSTASTTGDVVAQISTGVEVEILSGPVEAEGFTWYEIRTTDGAVQGWMSAEFLDIAEVSTDALEEALGGIPSPTAEAASADFQTGDTVQLTENTVRIRAEGNLGANIINTFDAGTQFEITGDPVNADGFTWYPVTSVDDPSISGWVTVDFIEPAS